MISKLSSFEIRPKAVIYSLIYLIIIATIKRIDIPNNLFFYTGYLIPTYSALRLIFAIFLLFGFISFGKLILKKLHISLSDIDDIDQIILYFFIGSSLINLFLYILGLMNGYYFWIAIVITLPLIYLSYSLFIEFLLFIQHQVSHLAQEMWKWIKNFDMQAVSISPSRIFTGLLMITAFAEVVFLVLIRVLSPDKEGDVTTHYMPYYETVINNHGIYPNTVWYHYFYSKGSGLFFLFNMLTDKYGAQLITFLYVLLISLILYSLVKSISSSVTLRWFTISLFLSILWNYSEVSFSKLHLFEMSGVAFSIWVVAKIINKKKHIFLVSLCGITLVNLLLFSPKSSVFIIPFFYILTAWFFFRKKFEEFKRTLIICVMISVGLMGIMGQNYIATGMFEDTPVRFMWNLADQHKFSQWVSPYMMLYVLEGSEPSLGTFSINLPPFAWYLKAFRLDRILLLPFSWKSTQYLLVSITSITLLIFTYSGYKHHRKQFSNKAMVSFLCSIVICIAIVLPIALKQWVSLQRTYIFVIFVVILWLVGLWEMGVGLVLERKKYDMLLNTLVFIGWLSLVFNFHYSIFPIFSEDGQTYMRLPHPSITKSTNYISGKTSFASFTTISDDIDVDYYEAHRFIGDDERILSLNFSFGLPGRSIEREIDYAYKEWHLMAFEEPETAKNAFQREGINYFLISTNPDKNLIFGALLYSPLFHPDHIQDNFDIIWKSEQTCLLTWKGTSLETYPWDKQFIKAYNNKLADEGLPELYERVKLYYQEYGTNYPVYADTSLSPVKGWQ